MKILSYTLLLMTTLIVFAFKANDDRERIVPSNKIVQKSLTVSSFNKLEVSSSVNVNFTQSTGNPSIEVSGPDNLVDKLIVKNENGKLKIQLKEKLWIIYKSNSKAERVSVKITAPAPNKINMSGATSFTASALNVNNLEVDLSGASSFAVAKLVTKTADIEMDGASDMKLAKAQIDDVDVEMSGASKLNIANLAAAKTELEVSGASNVEIGGNTTEINLNVSGASKVKLLNFKADTGNVAVSGASKAQTHIAKINHRSVTGISELDNTL